MKNISWFFILLLLFSYFSCKSSQKQITEIDFQQISDEDYGEPLLVLIQVNPWLLIGGSDSPTFVLYDNGKLIYQIIENNEINRYLVNFTQDEMNDFIEYLSIDEALYKMDNVIASYGDVSPAIAELLFASSDQIFTILYLNITENKVITVYGNIDLLDRIRSYRNEDAIKWIPPKIEIIFWDYNYAPNKRQWIDGFPDLNSPSTVNRRNGLFSVFIERDKYEIFFNYMREREEYEAVEINGKKMAISFRIPFPNVDELNLLW
jgi:hypothetical protein